MPDPEFFHGRETVLEIGDTSATPTYTDISEFLNDATPTLSATTVDLNPFGSGAWARKLSGQKSGSFALAGYVDNGATGATAKLQALFESGARLSVNYYPTGKVTGRRFMNCTGIISSFSPKSTSTDAVSFTSEIQIDGEPTWDEVGP